MQTDLFVNILVSNCKRGDRRQENSLKRTRSPHFTFLVYPIGETRTRALKL